MNSFLLEASVMNRQALREISDNSQAQQRATATTTTPPKKQSASDVKVFAENNEEDRAEVDVKNSISDKIEIKVLEAEKGSDKNKEQVTNLSNPTSILPDIVNVQPTPPPIVTEEADDSIITSLTKNLNSLNIDSKGDITLTVPTSTCDAISSDEEIFAECQTYLDQPASLGDDKNRSINWDVVLSNVTSSNLEILDNTTEQVVSNFDLDVNHEFVDSGIQNSDINTSHLPVSSDCEAECTEVSLTNVEKEARKEVTLNNTTINLKTFCKKAIPNYIEDQNLDVSSSVCIPNEFENKLKTSSDSLHESDNKTNELNETSSSSKSKQNKGNNHPSLTSDPLPISESDTLLPSNIPPDCLEEVNALEKLSCTQQSKEEIQSNDPVFTMKQANEMEKTFTTKQNSDLNQTVTIPTVTQSNNSNGLTNRNRKQGNRTIPAAQKSKYATYRVKKPIERPNPVEEIVQNSNGDDEKSELNNTFGLGSEEATIDSPAAADQTFDAVQLNGTYDANSLESILNEAVEATSPLVEKIVNEAVGTTDNNLGVDMSKTIVVEKGHGNDDVEPMDVDMFSPEKCVPERSSVLTQDVFVENLSSAMNVTFKAPSIPSTTAPIGKRKSIEQPSDFDFHGNGLILNPADFDYLLTKGNNTVPVDDRNSLLLRFDPLVGHSVPVNQPVINNQNRIALKPSPQRVGRLSPAAEEDDDEESHGRGTNKLLSTQNTEQDTRNISSDDVNQISLQTKNIKTEKVPTPEREPLLARRFQDSSRKIKNDDKMSIDVIQGIKIEHDPKSEDNISPKFAEKEDNKMDDLEKKIKNEVLKTEDIEKKLKDAEQREEALLKRITEKDKSIAKMSGVIEAYEKAIAELIAEKEQIIQNYEKQMSEIKSERDRNYQHLTSLETTFSDLHVKYERSKQLTSKLKTSEEDLKAEKRQNVENLRLQEQRYEKMKNHAIQQLEIANNKLESLSKDHAMEVTRLKALLKKEEISRLSLNEQLQQKSRENEELMKICDELINGQGASS